MNCEKCKSSNVVTRKRTDFTQDEVRRQAASQHFFAPKTPPEAMVKAGIWVATVAARAAFSEVYECKTCGHNWRKWF
jgi:hypothetical protein